MAIHVSPSFPKTFPKTFWSASCFHFCSTLFIPGTIICRSVSVSCLHVPRVILASHQVRVPRGLLFITFRCFVAVEILSPHQLTSDILHRRVVYLDPMMATYGMRLPERHGHEILNLGEGFAPFATVCHGVTVKQAYSTRL